MRKTAVIISLFIVIHGTVSAAGAFAKTDLRQAMEGQGFRFQVSGTNISCIASNKSQVVCHPGSRLVQVNGRSIWLNAPIESQGNSKFTIAKADLDDSILPAVKPAATTKKKALDITVVLDPGHGGSR